MLQEGILNFDILGMLVQHGDCHTYFETKHKSAIFIETLQENKTEKEKALSVLARQSGYHSLWRSKMGYDELEPLKPDHILISLKLALYLTSAFTMDNKGPSGDKGLCVFPMFEKVGALLDLLQWPWCPIYTPIAFDERVTFWLQRAQSLPCACAFAALCVCVCVMVICEPPRK